MLVITKIVFLVMAMYVIGIPAVIVGIMVAACIGGMLALRH